MSSADKLEEKNRARDLFDRVTADALGSVNDGLAHTNGQPQGLTSPSSHKLGEVTEMYIEIAKLYQGGNTDRMERAYKQALKFEEQRDFRKGYRLNLD